MYPVDNPFGDTAFVEIVNGRCHLRGYRDCGHDRDLALGLPMRLQIPTPWAIVSNLKFLGFSKNCFFRKFKIELGVFGDFREVRTGRTVLPGKFSADLVVYGVGKSTFQHFPVN